MHVYVCDTCKQTNLLPVLATVYVSNPCVNVYLHLDLCSRWNCAQCGFARSIICPGCTLMYVCGNKAGLHCSKYCYIANTNPNNSCLILSQLLLLKRHNECLYCLQMWESADCNCQHTTVWLSCNHCCRNGACLVWRPLSKTFSFDCGLVGRSLSYTAVIYISSL